MQTTFKKHPGAVKGSQIIFMVCDPKSPLTDHQTGCVVSAWQTDHKTSYVDAQGEQHMLNGLILNYVGASGNTGAMILLVDAPREKIERTLAGLHELPDDGLDLSMVQPMFACTIDGARPGQRGEHLQQLKLARLAIRG